MVVGKTKMLEFRLQTLAMDKEIRIFQSAKSEFLTDIPSVADAL